MRYPESNKHHHNSINLSDNISVVGEGSGGSPHRHPLRLPSSSSASQESQNSLHDPKLLENEIPGRTLESRNGVGDKGNNSIETISEHVLFGNNNGHNSFLYLYYSSSSNSGGNRNNINTQQNGSLLKRPYTTGGEGVVEFNGPKIMGSNGNERKDSLQKQHPWNDLTSGGHELANPNTIFANNNEDEDEYFGFENSGGKAKRNQTGFSSEERSNDDYDNRISNDLTPYPVYLSPMDGSPLRSLSISPKQKSRDGDDEGEDEYDEESRTSSRITGGLRQDRLDPFGADLLNDDWEKVYNVQDVNPRYIMSPAHSNEQTETERKPMKMYNDPLSHKSTNEPLLHEADQDHLRHQNCNCDSIETLEKQSDTFMSPQSSTTGMHKVNITKSYLEPNHHTRKQVSEKKGRMAATDKINEGGEHGVGQNGRHVYSRLEGSKENVKNGGNHKSNKRLTPMGSLDPSRSPSTRSINRSNSTPRHGVTHHHKPLDIRQNDEGDEDDGESEYESSSVAGDHMDQMSFQFQNGIGAFFGTPASKQISQHHEPTPEEMYKEEMQSWRPRLATGATIFFATVFILSSVSLLFVFPILVDPILVGFEAEFSKEPVMCRTTNFRNGSGPSECATPSCREGCTVDLFSCIFVDVEYLSDLNQENQPLAPRNSTKVVAPSSSSSFNMLDGTRNISITPRTGDYNGVSVSGSPTSTNNSHQRRSATLLINVNGCGYPPQVTCSEFERKYAPLNTQFPCYYSKQNDSIVVPEYSRRTEIIHLTLAMCVPFATIFTSGILLYLLVRYQKYLKMDIYQKYAERKRAIRAKRRDEWEDAERNAALADAENRHQDDTTMLLEAEFQHQGIKPIAAVYNNGASYPSTRLKLDSTEM